MDTHRETTMGGHREKTHVEVCTPRTEASELALPTPGSRPPASAALGAGPGVRVLARGLRGFRASEWVGRAVGSCLSCHLIPTRDLRSRKGPLVSSSASRPPRSACPLSPPGPTARPGLMTSVCWYFYPVAFLSLEDA